MNSHWRRLHSYAPQPQRLQRPAASATAAAAAAAGEAEAMNSHLRRLHSCAPQPQRPQRRRRRRRSGGGFRAAPVVQMLRAWRPSRRRRPQELVQRRSRRNETGEPASGLKRIAQVLLPEGIRPKTAEGKGGLIIHTCIYIYICGIDAAVEMKQASEHPA